MNKPVNLAVTIDCSKLGDNNWSDYVYSALTQIAHAIAYDNPIPEITGDPQWPMRVSVQFNTDQPEHDTFNMTTLETEAIKIITNRDKNSTLSDLPNDQLRTLVLYKLWNDGMDWEEVLKLRADLRIANPDRAYCIILLQERFGL